MKLDRRSALGVIGLILAPQISTGKIIYFRNANQPVSLTLSMDQYKDITITYKGKRQTFTTDEVMNSLFGEGTFGN